MTSREELIRSIITDLPSDPKPNGDLGSLRTDVVQLALNAQKEQSLSKPDIAIQSLRKIQGENEKQAFEVVAKQDFALSEMVKNFVDFTKVLKLCDGVLLREYGDIFEEGKYDGEALYSYYMTPGQSEIVDEKVVLLQNDGDEISRYTFKAPVLYRFRKEQQTTTIEPENYPLGEHTPGQVLEAYLLYLLAEK